jgi:hypothetical protein
MPPETPEDRVSVRTLLKRLAEKDEVIEGLTMAVSKQVDVSMDLVEELKKIKLAMNGNGGCSHTGIDWDERIMVNEQYSKTMSPKEMLIRGLMFLSKLEDLFIKYTEKRVLKKELTNLAVWNWKVVAIICMLLFGGSVGPNIWAFVKKALEEVLSRGTP